MPQVTYEWSIPYREDVDGRCYPRLTIQLSNPADPDGVLDLDAYLDSGAEVSLFDGKLAPALGLELLNGPEQPFKTLSNVGLTGRLHPVRIAHEDLGSFDLTVAFSTRDIARNVLGRDFFNLTQVGFRERQRIIYLSATP